MGTILTQRRPFIMKMVGIILVLAALIAGMVGCARQPSRNLEIRDWYDLHAVRDNLEGNHRLMNDLDATTAGYEELASPMANEGKGWEPIGYWDLSGGRGRPFMGTFDGQGYQIRDLYIDRPDEDTVGLFGAVAGFKLVEEGIVANVGVINATVTGGSYVGALVGYNHIVVSQPGTVSNCYATGSVTGDEYVGGLVGSNVAGTVSGSHSVTSVTGHDYVGGLVGHNLEGTVVNSYSSGNVTGYANVGGLVGLNDDTVSNCYSSAWVTGEQSVGGLAAVNNGTVSDSFWDTDTSGQSMSDGGTGKNTTEMKDIATFTDTETEGLEEPWDITVVSPGETNLDYVWNIIDGETYPFLSWECVA